MCKPNQGSPNLFTHDVTQAMGPYTADGSIGKGAFYTFFSMQYQEIFNSATLQELQNTIVGDVQYTVNCLKISYAYLQYQKAQITFLISRYFVIDLIGHNFFNDSS